ncbi:myosin-2 heavy chain-like [Sinocyclocheilus rhinocerous]|uniref:myosin-2 heavy chain-like n=1 Tax=Sinocyclocheilus rhinocerous TaxID=307959 RepID=UPI0007B7B31F|nr:PREDICTED: myosin-2 heavy chain-like [Sinocyclocheilus rhinocerous]
MGWIENLLICSFFVSIYLLTQAECGPVDAASARSDEKDATIVAHKDFTRERRAIEDCSGLRKDLDDMKIKCRDSYKIAKDNIDRLKSQLDGLFKQVGTTQNPAKDVLNILQKVIDLQEMDAVLNIERDAAKIERLDKRRKEAESDLAEMKTGFSGSVEIFERAVSKINAETLKSDKATSTPLNELKKYLEDKLKQPGEQGDTAKQVLQIVILQIEAMELKTRISGKFKTQAQMDVIISKLEYKNGLLSDLKEEREDRKEHIQKIDVLIAALEKEILDLNAELSALKQTLVQLDEQTDGLDKKRIEIMDKIGKLKGKDEIISRILKLQFEFMEALITAHGQMKADEFKINDLQKELEKEQDRALYLDADNKSLRKKLFVQAEQCKDLMELYMNAEAELEAQVNNVLDKTSKTALQIILLGFEINQITNQIKASSSNDDLKRLRDEKLKELKLKKEELQQSDASSEKILKVISQMEEIWKLQSEDPDNLNKISNLQKELMNLISKLDDKMASKPMLKIIALQSDVTWISEMLKTVTTKAEIQKAELQKALDDIKHLLNEKNKELAAATGDISQLQKDIAALKKDVLRLQMEIDTIEGNAKQKIKDLQEKLKQSNQALDDANKSLKEKNATLSQQITKINNLLDEVRTLKQQVQEKESLLKARIADLERSLTMKEEENAKIHAENEKLKKNCLDNAECPELQKKYKEMQAEYNDTISKLNNDILKKAYIIKSLIDEVQDLDEQIAQGFPELRLELEEKKRELEEAKQKLQAEGSISAKTLDVLELLTDIGKLQENPTEDNAEKIRKLEAQLNSLLDELQSSGEKGLGLALKIMSIKESMSKLRQAQEQMQQKYVKEINGLENQIENKEKEILLLRANCELSDKLKDRIQQLEKELEESKQHFKKLQQESKDKIASLEKQIKTKDQQLAKTEDILQNTNAENAALIKQLNNLDDEIKKLKEEKKYALQKLEEEIADFKKQLKKQENALAEKDLYLKEKNEIIDILEKQRDNMKSELEKVKNKNRELEAELKTKDQQLANTEAKLKEINAENQDLIHKQKKQEKELQKVTEEKNELQKEISDLEKTLEAKKQELAKKDQELQKKDNEVAALQKQYADTKAELKEEKNKLNGVINENEKLRQNLIETQKQVAKLEEIIGKNEPPKSEWPKLDANTAHRRLVISQDEKEARTSLLPQPVPDTTERYDTAIAALGKDGYDSGKHYWEIGVNGKNCYVVGAARASAQRKGILTYGPSAGYWVILKNRAAKLFAMADRTVQLNTDALSVIGVQLDFKNNKVTFYDVERKLEIFSFTGNVLQGKIHPYIETCSDTYLNEPSLILKQPQSTGWLKQ